MQLSTDRKRFIELCRRIAGNGKDPSTYSTIYDCILRQHQGPSRDYHNFIDHILNQFLIEFDGARRIITSPDAVEMAGRGHDAVYDTRALDNEEKSARFTKAMMRLMGAPEDFIELVGRLILATKHDIPPREFDSKAIVDIDLSSLGYSPEVFQENTEKIRREYYWVEPDEKFFKGQADFFEKLLNGRETIYLTDFFRNKYEDRARKNLQGFINKYSK